MPMAPLSTHDSVHTRLEWRFHLTTFSQLTLTHWHATRDSGGGKVSYVEAWRVIEKAQKIFGFNGWSSRILEVEKE